MTAASSATTIVDRLSPTSAAGSDASGFSSAMTSTGLSHNQSETTTWSSKDSPFKFNSASHTAIGSPGSTGRGGISAASLRAQAAFANMGSPSDGSLMLSEMSSTTTEVITSSRATMQSSGLTSAASMSSLASAAAIARALASSLGSSYSQGTLNRVTRQDSLATIASVDTNATGAKDAYTRALEAATDIHVGISKPGNKVSTLIAPPSRAPCYDPPLPASLRCGMHGGLLESPLLAPCGHTMCSRCIIPVVEEGKGAAPCPLCTGTEKPTLKADDLFPNSAIEPLLADITVRCVWGTTDDGKPDPKGCPAVIPIGSRSRHEGSCTYALASCPYGSLECPRIRRIDLPHHKATCTHVPCPNKIAGCNFKSTKIAVDSHADECVYGVFRAALTQAAEESNALKTTVSEQSSALSAISGLVSALSDTVSALQDEVSALRAHVAVQESNTAAQATTGGKALKNIFAEPTQAV